MRKLTLEAFEILDAIDRKGSFSAAGEVLHKVPSTVSYTVGKIEGDLGVALFRRNGPRIEITNAGKELLREGRLLLDAVDSLECRVKRVASGWESEFRVAVDSLVPTDVLVSLIGEFTKVADATTLRLSEGALTGTWEALLDARADLVIAAGRGPSGGGFRSQEIAQLEFGFFVAPFHPLAKARGPLSEGELREHIAVVVADSARRLPLRSVGLLSGQPMVVVPNMRSKVRLLLEGLGAGYLPTVCAEQAVAAGSLVRKEVENPREPDSLSVAWRGGEEGNALAWWTEKMADPSAGKSLLKSIARSYGSLLFTSRGTVMSSRRR
jgi:DNA-binding transcriptional LysR family regulator